MKRGRGGGAREGGIGLGDVGLRKKEAGGCVKGRPGLRQACLGMPGDHAEPENTGNGTGRGSGERENIQLWVIVVKGARGEAPMWRSEDASWINTCGAQKQGLGWE